MKKSNQLGSSSAVHMERIVLSISILEEQIRSWKLTGNCDGDYAKLESMKRRLDYAHFNASSLDRADAQVSKTLTRLDKELEIRVNAFKRRCVKAASAQLGEIGGKTLRDLIIALGRAGLRIEQTTKGHFKVYAPKGIVLIGRRTGDARAVKNAISNLRRYGVNI
jgi:hypothetical protein